MNDYSVIISTKAHLDITECVAFVLNVSKEAAYKLSNDIFSAIESLSNYPERYPVFEMPKSFPFVVRKQVINGRYIALYYVDGNKVIVARVLDVKRSFGALI